MKYTLFCVLFFCLTTSALAQSGTRLPVQERDQRDPTVPSAEIQRRTRKIEPTVDGSEKKAAPPAKVAAPPIRPVIAARPSQPQRRLAGQKIALQSLAQSKAGSCTATLVSGNQKVTISFTRGRQARNVELPETQFADYAATIQGLGLDLMQLKRFIASTEPMPAEAMGKVSDANAQPGEAENAAIVASEQAAMKAAESQRMNDELTAAQRRFMNQALQPREIDLTSSFTLNDQLYRVVDFTKDAVLLEQIPLGKYIIVR